MPISQDRVLSILNEAFAMREAYARFRADITALVDQANGAPIAPESITAELTLHHVPPMEQTFAERAHFKATKAKNNYARKYMERKRRAAGTVPRSATPDLEAAEQAALARALAEFEVAQPKAEYTRPDTEEDLPVG